MVSHNKCWRTQNDAAGEQDVKTPQNTGLHGILCLVLSLSLSLPEKLIILMLFFNTRTELYLPVTPKSGKRYRTETAWVCRAYLVIGRRLSD